MPETFTRPGLHRSTNLLRALGEDAGAIWQHLSQNEIQHLSPALEAEPISKTDEMKAVTHCIENLKSHPADPAGSAIVWDQLGDLQPAAMADLLRHESPQVLAVILTRLTPAQCANLLSVLPDDRAAETLHRLYSLQPIHTTTIATIETGLADLLSTDRNLLEAPEDRVADILGQFDAPLEGRILDDLEALEAGLRARIEKKMFHVEDIRHLDPASIQTLLSHCDRETLIGALMEADKTVLSVVLTNMTQRAGDLFIREIEAANLTPADTKRARIRLIALIRTLSRRGDILIPRVQDHGLVE